mmetsp:Transcript_107348/g.333550  ORF Transcript_107348/g.333550 Transcript_107348/m.333550 type:complete len:322 (+) Transcript_107348:56-1021(+)
MKRILDACTLCAVMAPLAAATSIAGESATGKRHHLGVGSLHSRPEKPHLHDGASGFMRGPVKEQDAATNDAPAEDFQQEAGRMLESLQTQGDDAMTPSFARELGRVEAGLTSEGVDQRTLKEIRTARARACVEQELEQHEEAECAAFMERVCSHGSHLRHRGRAALLQAPPVPLALCEHFRLLGLGTASSQESRGALSGAGLAGPFFGAKGERPLPAQGFEGEEVEHQDTQTMTEDWQTEFGPAAGHRSFVEICSDFPDNEWCRLHMYDRRVHRWRTARNERTGRSGDETQAQDAAGRRGCSPSSVLAGMALVALAINQRP